MEDTFLGMVSGAIGRLLPELIKMGNKYLDNKHESDMVKSQVVNNIQVDVHVPETVSSAPLFLEPTKIRRIEIMNAIVRPATTYVILGLYVVLKIWWFIINPTAGITVIWTSEDMILLSGIVSFWFLGRVLDKK